MIKNLGVLPIILGLFGLISPVYAIESGNNDVRGSFSNYRLGVGDKLKIQVYGEQDLEVETTLTDAGTITYPLLGELGRLSVTPRKLTELVDISFEANDPELARKILDTLGETFIESRLTGRMDETRKAADWLAGRLQFLKEKLTSAEKQLQNYLRKEHLVDLEDVLTLTKGEIAGNTSRLAEARKARIEAENLYFKVKSMGDSLYTSVEIVPEVFADPVVQTLKQKQEEIIRKISEISQRFGEKHPTMMAARSELDSVNSQLKSNIASSVNGIKSRYEIALANERAVSGSLDTNKAQVQKIGSKQTQLGELQREVESNRNLYEMFFNRYKEASEAASMNAANIRFIDRANRPLYPIKPNKKLMIIAAFIATFFAGVMLVILLDYLDATLKSPEDVEVRVCAELPQMISQNKIPFIGVWENKKVLLLEFPHDHIPLGSDKLVAWLFSRDIIPLIAHPERNQAILANPEKLMPFIRLGCLLQVTAGSVTGLFGAASRQCALHLVEQNLVTVLASDAHNLHKRQPALRSALAHLKPLIGEQQANALVTTHPARMINAH